MELLEFLLLSSCLEDCPFLTATLATATGCLRSGGTQPIYIIGNFEYSNRPPPIPLSRSSLSKSLISVATLQTNVIEVAQMQQFQKALVLYKAKYEMRVDSLIKFIQSKTETDDEGLKNIQKVIMADHSSKGASISDDQLKDYFHLLAAAQAKVNIATHPIEDIRKHYKIKFKTKKEHKKEEPTKEEQQSIEPKKEQPIEPKKEQPKKEETKERVREDERQLSRKEEEKKVESKKNNKEKEGPQISDKKQTSLKGQNPKTNIKGQNPKTNKLQSAKPQGSYMSPQKPKEPLQYPDLGTIEENIVEEDRTSNYYGPTSEQFFAKHPEVGMLQLRQGNKPVQIKGYDKFGQNYFQPIIKFRVVYKDKAVYRRYTQFQNLMNYLNRRYEGFILPELPPKEGLKSNLSYFYGVDEGFLNDRQNKLEDMVNVLMTSKFINEDEILLNFLTIADYQVAQGSKEGAMDYLRSLGEIAFNAKELKSYGMAYYNYLKSFKKSDISTKVTDCYKEAEPILSYCLEIDNYRTAIIANFDKRREIFKELEVDKADRTLTITEFDKVSAASAAQVRNLDKEMNKYYELKSEQSWLGYLIGQKQYESDSALEQLKRRYSEIEQRLAKMQKNLVDSIGCLVEEKKAFMGEVVKLMTQWRKSIHP